MSPNDVKQIKVGKHSVGIVDLMHVIEEIAKDHNQKPDEDIQAELVERLSRKNYIPDNVKESFGKAFLREFKKFLGIPYDEDVSEGLEIKVLGPGCPQCNKLENDIMEMMAETGLAESVEHVTDIKEIGQYGVMGTPALIINGKVVAVGSVPPKSKIKKWLKDAAENYRQK